MSSSKTRRQLALKHQNWIKLAGFLGLIFFFGLIILKVDNMLLSSLLAFVLSYLLVPAVNALERAGISRALSTTFVFILIGATFAVAISSILPFVSNQFVNLRMEIPKYIEGLGHIVSETEERIQNLSGTLYNMDISRQIETTLQGWAKTIFEDLPSFLTKSLTTMLLAPFLTFFMVKDGRQITRRFLQMVPNSIFEPTLSLFSQINDQMGQFIRARLLESAIIAIIVCIGLLLLGFPFAPLLAIFAGLANLIPYLGPIIGAIPALLIAVINGEPTLTIFLVALVYFTAQLIDNLFIIPIVVAKIVDLHPVTVIVAIIIGAQLLGIIGMIISIPVASALKVTLGTVYRHMTDFRA